MKKIVSVLLCAALLMGLCIPAMADGSGYTVTSGVASVTTPQGFIDAYADNGVTSVEINENLFLDGEENISFDTFTLSKPTTVGVNGGISLNCCTLDVEADFTVNGSMYIGDNSSLCVQASESYWNSLSVLPTELDGPMLTNNGSIETAEYGYGISLSWPCRYSGNGTFDGGKFVYIDFLDYFGNLNGCYTDAQATVKIGSDVIRSVNVNTENGLKTALASNTYNCQIEINADVTLDDAGTYNAPCSVISRVGLTVGAGVTLNLGEFFNMFNGTLTVSGTLNATAQKNSTMFSASVTVKNGGVLNIGAGGDAKFSKDLTVEAGGQMYFNGFVRYMPDNSDDFSVDIAGTVVINGYFVNNGAMFVSDGGSLRVEGKDSEITYSGEFWETEDHLLYNNGFIRVRNGGQMDVHGALYNADELGIVGTMNIYPTAEDNQKAGVINGCVRNAKNARIVINRGTLNVFDADNDNTYASVLHNIGEIRVCHDADNPNVAHLNIDGIFYNIGQLGQVDGGVNVSGTMENYGEALVSGGTFKVEKNGYLNNSNWATFNVRNSGEFVQEGYVQNDNRFNIEDGGTYTVNVADADNTNNGDCYKMNSVICNNRFFTVGNGGEAYFLGGNNTTTFSAIVHNNGSFGVSNGGSLTFGGLLRNFDTVYNYGEFKVTDSARIKNHSNSTLQVGDSASYSENDYSPITWPEGVDTDEEKRVILNDSAQLRLAKEHNDDGVWYEKMYVLYDAKDETYENVVVVEGYDYFGGWIKVTDAEVRTENFRYDDNGNVSDNGELDETEHIRITAEQDGYYTVKFVEWGDTTIVVEKNRIFRFDAGVALPMVGFYWGHEIFEDDGMLRERAQDGYITGGSFIYDTDDTIWLMRRPGGWDNSNNNIKNNTQIRIDDEIPTVQQDDKDGRVFHVYTDEDGHLLDLEIVERGDTGRYDIRVMFSKFANRDFNLDISVGGDNCSIFCIKPRITVKDAVAFKGEDVTVTFEADSTLNMLGYQLQVKFDNTELEAKSVEFINDYNEDGSPDYTATSFINNNNGTIRFIAGTTEKNGEGENTTIRNGDLFRVTFTVKDAVGDCDNLYIEFDDSYNEKVLSWVGDYKDFHVYHNCGRVQTFIPGDVYRDGEVDIRDAVHLLRYCAGLTKLETAEKEAALVAPMAPDCKEPSVTCVLNIMNYLASDTPLTYRPQEQD